MRVVLRAFMFLIFYMVLSSCYPDSPPSIPPFCSTFRLGSNQIGDAGASSLAEALKENKTIPTIE
jgi:hypothetical protein